jgi:hypothetical protein
MQVRLERAGVTDVRGLWDLTEADSVRIWGSVEGARWWRGFHAVDEPRVPKKRSSMSHGMICRSNCGTRPGPRHARTADLPPRPPARA